MCVISIPLWLIILIAVIYSATRNSGADVDWKAELPKLKGRRCEVEMKEVGDKYRYALTSQGTLEDFDEEWILLVCPTFDGEIRKVVRISEIKSVKAMD